MPSALTAAMVSTCCAASSLVEARQRLVEQDHPRIDGQRPRHLQPLHLTERQAAGKLALSVPASPTWLQNLGGALALAPAVDVKHRAQGARRAAIAGREHDIVEHRHLAERPHDLMRQRQPFRARGTRWQSLVTSWPASAMRPRSGRSTPATMRISVVLPAPLGPIRPTKSPWRHGKRDAVDRLHAAEADGDIVEFEAAVMRVPPWPRAPLQAGNPPGARRITSTSKPAEHQQAIVVDEPDRLRQQRQSDGRHHDAPGRADSADDHHGHQHHRQDEVEGVGVMNWVKKV